MNSTIPPPLPAHKPYSGRVPCRVLILSGEYAGRTGKAWRQIKKLLSHKEPDVFRVLIDGFPRPGGWDGQVYCNAAHLGELTDQTPPPEAKDIPRHMWGGD